MSAGHRRTRIVAAASFVAVAAGCGGDGEGLAPRLRDVEPNWIAPGRQTSVRITAELADFDPSRPIAADFGDGLTAVATVASPVSIAVELTAAEDAAYGARDVVLRQGSLELRLDGSFEVAPPFAFDTTELAQGELNLLRLHGRGTRWSSFGADAAIEGALVLGVYVVDEDDAEVLLKVDLFAEPGARDVALTSGGARETARGALTVVPVEVRSLPSGATAQDEIDLWGEFHVFHVPAAGVPLTRVRLENPQLYAWTEIYRPSDGRYVHELLEDGDWFDWADSPEDLYLVVRDPSFYVFGASPLPYSLHVEQTAVTPLAAGDGASDLGLGAGAIGAFAIGDAGPRWSVLSVTASSESGASALAPAVDLLDPATMTVRARTESPDGGSSTVRQVLRGEGIWLAVVSEAEGGDGGGFDLTTGIDAIPGTHVVDDGLAIAYPPLVTFSGNETFSRTMTVGGIAGTISRVHLGLDLEHGFRGVTRVTLIAPDGTEAIVQEFDYTRQVADYRTVWPDVTPAASDLDAVFGGKDPNGTWTLRLSEHAIWGGPDRTLHGWMLSLETQ